VIFAELIDGIFCEMGLNKMIAIAQLNLRDVLMDIDSHWFFQVLRHLVEIEVGIKECRY
jgi:hypothetical protein